MSKRLQSQWEFGELFPAEEIRKVLTVSEITGSIRRLLEKEMGQLWVTGEISNLRIQSSGHVYFTLKDSVAQLSCVLFRNEARTVNRDFLTDGQKVVLQGDITVYEARGQYQLRVLSVQLQGVGALQAAFERLKQKLQAEGLFDQGHKRPIPPYPQRIGLVTSSTGAAIRDLLHAVQRRNPALHVLLAPCRVQGIGAAAEIAAAINALNEWSGSGLKEHLDLILITRGGGSLEDLWAFNEELVARAIYNSRLPVISAVGHEIDFTISDFVADLRAATPTAAGEIITEGVFSARQFIARARESLSAILHDQLQGKRDELQGFTRRLHRLHPRRRLDEYSQRLDDLRATLSRCAAQQTRHFKTHFQNLLGRVLRTRPAHVLARRREAVLLLSARLHESAALALQRSQEQVRTAALKLHLLSPQNILNRGYSVTVDPATGAVLRNAAQVESGQEIVTTLQSGKLRSVVKETKPGQPPPS